MNLYTIVLEYRGGTYVRQLLSTGPKNAVVDWADSISDDDAQAWSIDSILLRRCVAEENIVEVNGCVGVWCSAPVISGELALINVIRTAQNA